METKYNKAVILGLMSGTSLDGLDLALCEFEHSTNAYNFKIIKSQTVEYTEKRKKKLMSAKDAGALAYFHLHHEYGQFIAEQINRFLSDCPIKPVAVASHGHTIFHQPSAGFSTQMGCGATIAAETRYTTVCDFRSLDTANGGQGAPLVPIGDKLLFGRHEACLNIGGIANISFDKKDQRIAYDVCFANMALNFLAEKIGKPYDENGDEAFKGKVSDSLLTKFTLVLHSKDKLSLSRENFEQVLLPIIAENNPEVKDQLATFCEFVAQEISNELDANNLKNVLITGGGAYNKFLIERIKSKFKGEVILPEDNIIQFKEALIFAFLGYLRLNEKINTLKSVTGAKSDSVGGAVYYGKR